MKVRVHRPSRPRRWPRISGSVCRKIECVKLGWEEARALRLERHHLHRRAPLGSELRVAGRICGLHAQLLSSAALSLWARIEGTSLEWFQRALWRERTLVKIWAMRGTLHLLPARDLPVYLGALGTYRHYLTQRWVKYFGVTRKEIELVIETVGEVLSGRALTRDQHADAVVERTGSKKPGVILRPQGWISPVLLVDGHVEGVWRHERRNGRLEVLIEPFTRQPPRVRAGAAEEAERLAVFLGPRLDKLAWR